MAPPQPPGASLGADRATQSRVRYQGGRTAWCLPVESPGTRWAHAVKPISSARVRGHAVPGPSPATRSEEHTSELQSQSNLVCRLLLEKKKKITTETTITDSSMIGSHYMPTCR